MPRAIVMLLLAFCCLALPHLIHPVDYCHLAATCEHDNLPICGSDSCNRRSFLDVCDMYEYNCDYQKRFQTTGDDCNDNPTTPETTTTTIGTTSRTSTDSPQTTTTSTTTSDTPHTEEDTDEEHLGWIVTNKREFLTSRNTRAICEPHCGPKKWSTTAKGETRDFFRILKSH
ncbi:uncharacterized protein isoform X1 [Choristoneura fumiferana]|uniref:uncharacterized protein isoform X1 n=1 Tax=Choristoneura fumiferana TaxID=7141 RepID=UPI003D1580FA